MITSVISDTSIMFVARGRVWTVASDHGSFKQVKKLLAEGYDDAEELVRMVDVRIAVQESSDGKVVLNEDGAYLEGVELPKPWQSALAQYPQSARVLLVSPGDRVRVEGDEDAPDGIYVVGECDDGDVEKRVYVESEEDYFGFVANTSIKEIISADTEENQAA